MGSKPAATRAAVQQAAPPKPTPPKKEQRGAYFGEPETQGKGKLLDDNATNPALSRARFLGG